MVMVMVCLIGQDYLDQLEKRNEVLWAVVDGSPDILERAALR
jgi:hypothetical protein